MLWLGRQPAKKMDDQRHALKFSPRKPKSVWSKPNKERVEQLLANGLMTPIGLAKIEQAKQNGSWDALNDSDNLIVADDLAVALSENPVAGVNFHNFSPGSRKIIPSWIGSANRPETRANRITETVQLAELGKRANFPADR